jgi:MYXO-CTERM domain-containing protein
MLATGVVLAAVSGPIAKADVIDIGTATADWKITGAGATSATPFHLADGLSITSNALWNGTFISGGSLAAFTGFWVAELDFTLPADAGNVALSFSNLFADDRVVLELNGNLIGNMYLNPAQASGVMMLTAGGSDDPFTFTNSGNTVSGGTNTGFNIGGLNTLLLIVNNTDSTDPNTATQTLHDAFDATYAQLDGTITSTGAPEPACLSLLALGGLALLRRRHAGK